MEFLLDGAARSDRLVYVADRPDAAALAGDLALCFDVERHVAEGSLQLVPVHDLYEPDGRFDDDRQVARYRELTARAIRDGYAGLRVAADATSLVGTPEARSTFVGYELAVNAVMDAAPFSALCGYDTAVLGEAAAMELCVVHPQRHAPPDLDPGFSLFHRSGALKLVGEVDFANSELFEVALSAVDRTAHIVIDLSDLDFVDVRGLHHLESLASAALAAGGSLRLTRARPIIRRCCEAARMDTLAAAVEVGAP